MSRLYDQHRAALVTQVMRAVPTKHLKRKGNNMSSKITYEHLMATSPSDMIDELWEYEYRMMSNEDLIGLASERFKDRLRTLDTETLLNHYNKTIQGE